MPVNSCTAREIFICENDDNKHIFIVVAFYPYVLKGIRKVSQKVVPILNDFVILLCNSLCDMCNKIGSCTFGFESEVSGFISA